MKFKLFFLFIYGINLLINKSKKKKILKGNINVIKSTANVKVKEILNNATAQAQKIESKYKSEGRAQILQAEV